MTRREFMKIPKKVRVGLGHLAALAESTPNYKRGNYGKQTCDEMKAAILWVWNQWAKVN